MTALSGWVNFYVIVGSSAGALIGLQFVVLTLVSSRPMRPGMEQAGFAFSTPTIIHFGAVLLLSGVMSAPWQSIAPAAALWGVLGLCGVIYVASATRRMATQPVYKLVLEDWLFHSILPMLSYGVLAVSGALCRTHPYALFCVAGAGLLLLFIGIHNAWDAVTYHVFVVGPRVSAERDRAE